MSPPASRRPYASNLRPVVSGVCSPDGLIWVIPVTRRKSGQLLRKESYRI